MTAVVLALPWILLTFYLLLYFRDPPELPEGPTHGFKKKPPMVSVVIPARNEEENIIPCVESLASSHYPAFEILVVDDRSQDGTVERLQDWASGRDVPLRVISGQPLPPGWFGKPWACWQGAQVARGDVFLFTDADTFHASDLLTRSVQELLNEEADALTLSGRQIMGSFWEKVIQPQFFLLLAARYPRTGIPKKPHQWRNAVANGQYILMTRTAYESIGGHGGVAGEVVEDVRLAQRLVKGGMRLVVRETQGLQTRMYRSLAGLVEGWSKNIATAAVQTTTPGLQSVILPVSALAGVILWLLPPGVLVWSGFGDLSETLQHWALLATGIGVFVLGGTSNRMGGSPVWGLFFPLASLVGLYIFLRSWFTGDNIRWKDRRYGTNAVDPVTEVSGAGEEGQ